MFDKNVVKRGSKEPNRALTLRVNDSVFSNSVFTVKNNMENKKNCVYNHKLHKFIKRALKLIIVIVFIY